MTEGATEMESTPLVGAGSPGPSPGDTHVKTHLKLDWNPAAKCLKLTEGTHGSPVVTADLQGSQGSDVAQISFDTGVHSELFSNVLCLTWENADSLPAAIRQLSQLTSLHLSRCKNCDLERIGNLPQLKELELAFCDDLQHWPGAISRLSQLTALELYRWSSLQGLPEAISQLSQLSSLMIDSGSSLPDLHGAISPLVQLTKLHLHPYNGIYVLPLLEAISSRSQLSDLLLGGCDNLKVLPTSISRLSQLTALALVQCSSLDKLPEEISQLSQLSSLELVGCGRLKVLPEATGKLSKLTILHLQDCYSLKALPNSITQLEALKCLVLDGCSALDARNLLGLQGRIHGVFNGPGVDTKAQPITLEVCQRAVRREMVMKALLSDRDARHKTLESIAVIAILWATAAFVAFAQFPNMPEAFQDMFQEDDEIAKAALWLRYFFIADQITFYSSIAVVMLYLVSSLPRMDPSNKDIAVAHVWLGYVGLSLLLLVTVASGIFAFVAAAIVVYPTKYMWSDVHSLWIIAAGLLWVPVSYKWFAALKSLWPGWTAVGKWCWSRDVEPEIPLQGLDESAYNTMQAANDLVHEVQQLREESRADRAALKKQHEALLHLLQTK